MSRWTTESEQDCCYKAESSSPWFNSLPQIGSTCTKGPSFCCSCSNSSRYWLRRRNQIPPNQYRKRTWFRRRSKNTKNRGTRLQQKASKFQEFNRGVVLPGSVRWCRGPHNRHRGHRPGGGEAFVRGRQGLHGGGLDRGQIKVLPMERGGGGGGGRREDVIAFFLDFYRVYLLFRCAVKSIAQDSSEIEHTRRQKRQLPLGVSSAGSPPFYPLRRVYSGAIRWSRFFGSRRRLVILFFSFPCLRQ